MINGIWTNGAPPDIIEAGSQITISSKSKGIMSGTSAKATYCLSNQSTSVLSLSITNPFLGDFIFEGKFMNCEEKNN